jgi:hypothetical protein
MDRGAESVRSRKCFDSGRALRSFLVRCRPDSLQFALEHDAGFPRLKPFVEVPQENVQTSIVTVWETNRYLIPKAAKQPSLPTESGYRSVPGRRS